jgi:glucose uptake protein GlcU
MDDEIFVGYLCCLVAAVFFGSNYAPVKKLNVGDGVFFAVCMTSGVFFVGVLVQSFQGFPRFEHRATYGGCLWALGNLCVVPIVKSVGLAVGMLVWSSTCMLSGWMSARFGILGVEKQEVSRPALNAFGVALACAALYVASKIDGTVATTTGRLGSSSSSSSSSGGGGSIERRNEEGEENPFLNNDNDDDEAALRNGSVESSATHHKKHYGIALSLLSGFLYGVTFNPVENLRADRSGAHSDDALDYVFSHFCGILLTTLVAFALHYAHVVRKSTDRYPDIRQETVVPAFISGVMWGIAQTSWFVANKALSMSISFPIISTLPSVVAAAIGYFYFHEMRGEKNVRLLLSSGAMRLVSVACIANSR